MTPIDFPEANCDYGPPPDLEESQCLRIRAWSGAVTGGSVDGSPMVAVAWQPSEQDLQRLMAGGAIYLSMLGGLAPHLLATSFDEVTHPA